MSEKLTADINSDRLARRLKNDITREGLRTSESRRRLLERWGEIHADSYLQLKFDDTVGSTARVKLREDTPEVTVPSYDADQPVTNLDKKVYDLLLQRALTVHEIGHVLYTDQQAINNAVSQLPQGEQKQFYTIFNALEDGAIEKQLRREFAVEAELAISNANFRFDDTEGMRVYNMLQGTKLACLDLAVYDSGHLQALLDEDDDSASFDTEQTHQTFEQEVLPAIEDAVADVLTESDPEPRVERILELWMEIREYIDSTQSTDQSYGLKGNVGDSNLGSGASASEIDDFSSGGVTGDTGQASKKPDGPPNGSGDQSRTTADDTDSDETAQNDAELAGGGQSTGGASGTSDSSSTKDTAVDTRQDRAGCDDQTQNKNKDGSTRENKEKKQETQTGEEVGDDAQTGGTTSEEAQTGEEVGDDAQTGGTTSEEAQTGEEVGDDAQTGDTTSEEAQTGEEVGDDAQAGSATGGERQVDDEVGDSAQTDSATNKETQAEIERESPGDDEAARKAQAGDEKKQQSKTGNDAQRGGNADDEERTESGEGNKLDERAQTDERENKRTYPQSVEDQELSLSEKYGALVDKQEREQQSELDAFEGELDAFSDALNELSDASRGPRSLEVHDGHTPRTENWSEIQHTGRQIERILDQQLQEEQQDKLKRGKRRGQVDPRSLSRVSVSDTRIFRQRDRPDTKDYAAIIVIDRSGSMGSHIEVAENAAVTLAYALEELSIDTCVMDMYRSRARLAKPFGADVETNRNRLLTGETGGGTPLSDVLCLARKRVQERNEHPFLIAITDGQPANQSRYLEELKQTRFPVVGVYTDFSADSVADVSRKATESAQLYDRQKFVTQPDELSTKLEALCREVMF